VPGAQELNIISEPGGIGFSIEDPTIERVGHLLRGKVSPTPEPRAGQANKESGRVRGHHACSAEGLPPGLKPIQLSHMDS
jgi:hypothetical protein